MVEFAEILSACFGIELRLDGRGQWTGEVTRAQWDALKDAVEGVAVPV